MAKKCLVAKQIENAEIYGSGLYPLSAVWARSGLLAAL